MNDNEMRRALLEYGYEHRYETGLCGIADIPLLQGVEKKRINFNLLQLKKQGYVENLTMGLDFFTVTCPAIELVEHPESFDGRFPIRFDVPAQTKVLVETVGEVLEGKCDEALRQFRKARRFLYDTSPPDYLNCIKESVGALEAVAKVVTNEAKKTLGDLIPQIRKQFLGHPALGKVIEGLYGARSDWPGVAHGQHEEKPVRHADAEFVLNTCAAMIIYLMRTTCG